MSQPLDLSALSGLAEQEIFNEAAKGMLRQVEALRLYEPLPYQEVIHRSRAKKKLLLKANRTGGTLLGAIEMARALTGQDPHNKYPTPVLAAVIGYGQRHIGNVFHKYLFEPGAFHIIKDLHTKQWRVFRPWKGIILGKDGDEGREKESRPAPPLIPERFLETDSIAWLDKRQNVFTKVTLKNGSELLAYNSEGEWKHSQGTKRHFAWIDEDLAQSQWAQEIAGRLIDLKGTLLWTGLWHGDNAAMDNIVELAEQEEAIQPDPDKRAAVVFTATIYDNPYLPEESRDAEIKQWMIDGDDVYQRRALGKRTLEGKMMYPQFHIDKHGMSPDELPGGEVPAHWCRYLVIDPGVIPASVTFYAVPPPAEHKKYGNILLCYDELQIQQCTAAKLAAEVKRKVQGQEFEAFIIDEHGSRKRDDGLGVTTKEYYRREFERAEIVSNRTESGFLPGSDDVEGRTRQLRSMLVGFDYTGDQEDCIQFRVLKGHTPRLVAEFKRYKKKVDGKGMVIDTPNVSGIHLAVTCEYMAAYAGARKNALYVRPKHTQGTKTAKWIMDYMKQNRQRTNRSIVNLS